MSGNNNDQRLEDYRLSVWGFSIGIVVLLVVVLLVVALAKCSGYKWHLPSFKGMGQSGGNIINLGVPSVSTMSS